ncbi:protein Dok-7-like isoform X2 [Betta splendens]|uniref:Protein Dok-7-like isoform X2 n=1 Tax=Betta splendens TaxID=158456 RepID=A0A6P7L228_BETSP|nr:protein Dok-7-like isoform X2 [Betta splendens]
MTDSVVVEGYARLRDGKKWKTRWLVLRKPSPVADCLLLLVYKDRSDKAQGNRERAGVTLEQICGLEAGPAYEGAAFTLAVLCLNQAALLGFDSRDALQAWDARLRYSLGEVHRFSVGVLPGTKLEGGPATLHLCNNLLALARDVPPVVIGHWSLPDLRRYGPVPNGFVFEGGTRCGFWAGVFLLTSAESEQISFLFDCIVRGISPTRGPFGLRPLLPDPGAGQTDSEEKLNHEAQELEKRLSMLSHRSSTASSTYFPSAGGDDRSISGSSDASDTSRSDCSVGSRPAAWSEPAPGPAEGAGRAAAGRAAAGPAPPGAEKPPAGAGAGGRAAAKAPRQLQDIGRQSSADSGIASGSHSSYSGSCSSYAGSLDTAPGEDFGSVFSLPPHLAHDLSPCSCSTAPGHEYQVPTSLRYLYDSPRSLLQEGSEGTAHSQPSSPTRGPESLVTESGEGEQGSAAASQGPTEGRSMCGREPRPSEEAPLTKTAPPADRPDSCLGCSSLTPASKTIVTICAACGGFKGTPYIPTGASGIPALPPDQGVVTSPCRAASAGAHSLAAEEPRAQLGSGSTCGSAKANEESPLLAVEGGDGLARLLADLLSVPSAQMQPEANVYVPMSPAVASDLKPVDSRRQRRDAIYENCLKCQSRHCHPPSRVGPAEMYHNGNAFIPQTPLTGKKSQEELPCPGPSDGEQGVEGRRRLEEAEGPASTSEEKRLNSKEERRRTDPDYEVMESRKTERNTEAEEKSKYEPMGSCSQQRFLQEAEGPVFVFPPDAALPERSRSEGVTYVNIPVSPTSKKQLNYMELELQEPGLGTRGTAAPPPAQRKTSTRYAQIDITATETAHKVGTQHALGRQGGLHTLELRRRATPH